MIAELARDYHTACPDALIHVAGNGTNKAIVELIQGGRADEQTRSTEASRVKLAMADDNAG